MSFIAQNYGAGKDDRVSSCLLRYLHDCRRIFLCVFQPAFYDGRTNFFLGFSRMWQRFIIMEEYVCASCWRFSL